MTPTMRILRHVFLMPVSKVEKSERKLREIQIGAESAQRTVSNAREKLEKTATRLHSLTAEVLERNAEAKE